MQIKQVAGFKMITESEMEKWRASTFESKEPETLEWIRSFSDNAIFFDIGANIGVYSLFCASIHPRAVIYAFEPDLNNHHSLLTNIGINNYNIIPFRCGMSENVGLANFQFTKEAGESGGQIYQNTTLADTLVISVDWIVESHPITMPNHIKIDVDGNEFNIVKGMLRTMRNPALKSVLIEIDKDKNDAALIVELFKQAGMTLNNDFNSLENHSRYRREQEGIGHIENVVFTRE